MPPTDDGVFVWPQITCDAAFFVLPVEYMLSCRPLVMVCLSGPRLQVMLLSLYCLHTLQRYF